MSWKSPKLYYLFLAIILVPVFWLFGDYYAMHSFPGYNSDHAIHAMMTQDFLISKDLYYWNQNRLGSFIPMFGAVFASFGISAINSVVLVQYILLTSIFLFISDLLKNKWLSLPLVLIVFLPHSSFINQVLAGHPYLAQFFFICLILWMMIRRDRIGEKTFYFTIPLLFGFAIWSSEISLASAIVFAAVFFKDIKPAFKKPNIVYPLVGLSLSVGFIAYAKAFSYKTTDFDTKLISLEDNIIGLKKVGHFIWETATFSTNKPPNTYLFYSLVLLLLLVLVFSRSVKIGKITKFFFWSAIGSFILVTLANWWMVSSYPLRYFAFSFFQFLLALIFLVDDLKAKKWAFYIPISAIAICVAFSGLYLTKYFSLKVPDRATKEEMLEISNMGDFGILGSYWNTYAIDAYSKQIEATPNEGYAVRHKRGVEKVFENDSIMVIKNGYKKTLPDTIIEFNKILVKTGLNKELGQLEYAFYKEIKK